MTKRTCGRLRPCAALVALLFAASALPSVAKAQVVSNITPDGTLGTTVSGPGFYEINGGTIRGSNQFHSFDRFSVGTGDAAYFNGPAGIQNIVSRVTGLLSGPAASQIDGTLGSLLPGANVFLMNPAGIMLGPNAQLDLTGSFHATTANYMRFGEDIFHSDPAQGTSFTPTNFTVATPSAFGFLSANPAAIEVNTSSFLTGAPGQTLSFVGGPVTLGVPDGSTPGYVFAPEGRVNLVSVASAGEAVFDGTGFNVAGVPQLGSVKIQGGSIVDGKDIFIRGGALTIDDGVIVPQLLALFGLAAPAFGGEVNINVTGDVKIAGTRFDPLTGFAPGIYVFAGNLFDLPTSEGSVPSVNINAKSVSVSGFAGIQSNRLGPDAPGGVSGDVSITAETVNVSNGGSIAMFNAWEGPGGNLIITARDVNLSGDGSPSAVGFEGIGSQGLVHPAYPFYFLGQDAALNGAMSNGDSGNVTLNLSGTLNVSGQAQIVTDSLNFGRGGDINIKAGDIVLVGAGAETGLIGAQSALAGEAGNINIVADRTIRLQNGFRISSSTVGAGSGGTVTVTAGESITFEGADSRMLSLTVPLPDDEQNALFVKNFGYDFDAFRGLFAGFGYPADADLFTVLGAMNDFSLTQIAGELRPGAGGTVVVNAPVLTLNAGTRIETSTGWDGKAGSIEATVGSMFLNGGASLNSTSGFQRLTGEAIIGTGEAGAITVSAADTISVAGAGSRVSTSTFGDGKAGDVKLHAGQVIVSNGGRVTSRSGGVLGGMAAVGSGSSGNVKIEANNAVTVSGAGSEVSTTTYGDGTGGNVFLSANQVNVQSGGRITSESGGSLGGALTAGTGAGGLVTISAGSAINVSGQDAVVSTSTFGNGDGGNISLNAGNSVQIADGGVVSADSLALVGAGTGLAGNITITSGDSITMDSGTISTRAVTSDGGDIKLDAPGTVYLNNSQITTSVESGIGGGGNISIDPQFVILNNSFIIANAFGGPGGNITIIADNFLSSSTSVIEASSALSTPGVIQIQSPDNNVENSIAQLTAAFLDASSQLRGLCSARRTGAPSSFTVAGRGGVPVEADGYLPSFGAAAATASASAAGPARAAAGGIDRQPIALALVMPDSLNCMR